MCVFFVISGIKAAPTVPQEMIVDLVVKLNDITVNTDDEGVLVKADTLGSLEAVGHLLKEMDIPISIAGIGDVNKRDVINASIARDENEEYGDVYGKP